MSIVPEVIPEVDVKLYRPQEGDLLVLKVHGYLTLDQKQRVMDSWAAAVGQGFGHIVLLDEGLDLEVVRKVKP